LAAIYYAGNSHHSQGFSLKGVFMSAEKGLSRREVLGTAGALACVAFAANEGLADESDENNQGKKKPAVKHHSRPRRTTAYHPKIKELLKKEPAKTPFSWGDLKAGNSTMHKLVVILQSDGKGRFTSTIESQDSQLVGDIWHIQFTAQDTNNQPLFMTQVFDSEAVKGPGKPSPFHGTFFFGP
jgi:hypothetical protein